MEVAGLVDAFCAGLRGERQWRNVQGVLLDSFRSLGEILALQTRQLAAAERQIVALAKRQQELERKVDAATSIPEDWERTWWRRWRRRLVKRWTRGNRATTSEWASR